MFAVPGWSLSSKALKTQTVEPSKSSNTQLSDGVRTSESGTASKTPNKRKRTNGVSKVSQVNSANLSDLWGTVIENRVLPRPADGNAGKAAKHRIHQIIEPSDLKISEISSSVDVQVGRHSEKQDQPVTKRRRVLKGKTREDKKKATQLLATNDGPTANKYKEKVDQDSKIPTNLTPLQASMRQKLVSARFRHLNQTLYTTPSSHSLELFRQNPEMFDEYHEGFRRQVEVWPENPVDGYIQQIRQRGKSAGPGRGRSKSSGNGDHDQGEQELRPLPRTGGICHIADLGCGDAGISKALDKEKKKLKIMVFSYDLQSSNPLVTKADIANLPLKDNSVDVAVFCLALMGVNWIDFIEEAFRILRWKGELWVAEIKSRFGRISGKGSRVDHSVGNKKKPDKRFSKKTDEAENGADLLVEVDGHEDMKGETDVSAFVEVLRKRGFILQPDQAVDLNNKMFVKMSFVKGQVPMKGKHVPVPKGMAELGLKTWNKKPSARFIDHDVEVETVSSESSVLKPCVYKLR